MLLEDNARYNIWKTLKDPFDYTEFCEACEAADLTPMGVMDFAMKVGRLMVAHKMYPDIPETEAYTKLSQEHVLEPVHPHVHKGGPKGITVGRDHLSPDLSKLPFIPLPPSTKSPIEVIVQAKSSCCGGGKVR